MSKSIWKYANAYIDQVSGQLIIFHICLSYASPLILGTFYFVYIYVYIYLFIRADDKQNQQQKDDTNKNTLRDIKTVQNTG